MRILNTNNQANILPLLAVGTFGLNVLTLLMLMFHGTMLQQLGSNRNIAQSLVQLADGTTITVDPKQYSERNPETIQRFVGETMTLMFTWSQKQPPRIVWQITSELLSNDLRQKFEPEIIKLFPDNKLGNISSGTETILVLQEISQPTKIDEGRWRLAVRANYLTLTKSDLLGKSIPFNRQILVRVADKKDTSIPDAPLPWHLAVRRLGEAKLEIYNICDIKDENCS